MHTWFRIQCRYPTVFSWSHYDFLMIVLGSSRVCHENSYKSMISPCFHHFPYVFPRVSLWFPQKFHLRFLPWFRGFHRWGGDFLDESSCVNPCPDGKFPEGKVRFSARWSRNGNHMGTLFWWERLPMWCFFFSLLFLPLRCVDMNLWQKPVREIGVINAPTSQFCSLGHHLALGKWWGTSWETHWDKWEDQWENVWKYPPSYIFIHCSY